MSHAHAEVSPRSQYTGRLVNRRRHIRDVHEGVVGDDLIEAAVGELSIATTRCPRVFKSRATRPSPLPAIAEKAIAPSLSPASASARYGRSSRTPSCRSASDRSEPAQARRSNFADRDKVREIHGSLRLRTPVLACLSVRFRLATRGSTLAMIQAQLAADALARRYPEHEFTLAPLTTQGDRHASMRLSESPREGVFVKDLEQALLDGRAELAVHSAKDLPTLPTSGLTLAAFLPREDPRDVLIAQPPGTLAQLPAGARIGTGSPRRAAQIAAVRPDLQTVEIRGNVDTRLRRLAEGAVDALVVAAAGLARLGRLAEAHELLPFAVMLPAPGQGALAIQAIEGSEAARLAGAIDDPGTSRAVHAERAPMARRRPWWRRSKHAERRPSGAR